MGSGYHRPGWLAAPAAPGVRDGLFSPDGAKLAYSLIDGILIRDLATGEDLPVPGTANGDFNPIWSPDGAQIVFNRGMGIFDLSSSTWMARTCARSPTAVQEWPVGWLEDGSFLYTVPGPGVRVHRLPPRTSPAAKARCSRTRTSILHPMASTRLSPGWPSVSAGRSISAAWTAPPLGAGQRQPVGSEPLWSASGEWLLATVSATDSGSTTGALINLRTCQVISLPHLEGNLLGLERRLLHPPGNIAAGRLRHSLFRLAVCGYDLMPEKPISVCN